VGCLLLRVHKRTGVWCQSADQGCCARQAVLFRLFQEVWRCGPEAPRTIPAAPAREHRLIHFITYVCCVPPEHADKLHLYSTASLYLIVERSVTCAEPVHLSAVLVLQTMPWPVRRVRLSLRRYPFAPGGLKPHPAEQ
jgi:hypothetical protein